MTDNQEVRAKALECAIRFEALVAEFVPKSGGNMAAAALLEDGTYALGERFAKFITGTETGA